MRIDRYRFGEIVIGGEAYARDVIVFRDRVVSGWRRRNGHSLLPEDLRDVAAASPSTLVLGRGALGMLRVPAETGRYLAKRGSASSPCGRPPRSRSTTGAPTTRGLSAPST